MMKRKGDWLEAPLWWRRYKPLRWVLAIVILLWIYVTATRMERGPALFPSEPAVSQPTPETRLPPPAAELPEKAVPKQSAPAPAPVPKKKPPEKQRKQDEKQEIRSLRPV